MKRAAPALLAAGALALAACGSSDPDPTPSACLQDAGGYVEALETAPGEVRLAEGVAISDCIVPEQATADLNRLGSALVAAATRLNREAQEAPAGAAARRLGYLVGSVEEGASETAGLHTDLVRRINSAARFSEDPDGFGAAFERAFGAGYAAAREDG